MDKVKAKLEEHGLESYAEAFEQNGFDSIDMIEGQTKEDLTAIAVAVGMKPGHQMKFVKLALPIGQPLVQARLFLCMQPAEEYTIHAPTTYTNFIII